MKKLIASFVLFFAIIFSDTADCCHFGLDGFPNFYYCEQTPNFNNTLSFSDNRSGTIYFHSMLPSNAIIETESRKKQDALVKVFNSMQEGKFDLGGFSSSESSDPEKISYRLMQIKALCSIRGNSIPDPVKATIFEFIRTTIPKKGTYIEHRGYYIPVPFPSQSDFTVVNGPEEYSKFVTSIFNPVRIQNNTKCSASVIPRFRLQIANS